MSEIAAGSGTAIVLEHLARPYDPSRVVGVLLGLPSRPARELVGAALATSEEAEHLLAAMPQILRSLAIATTEQPERCYGEIRGPVLWAETMSARSASVGDPGLYVCATMSKAYDTPENRVLKAALDAIEQAAKSIDPGHEPAGLTDGDEVARRARLNGHQAGRLGEHQSLSAVPVVRPSGRALQRTRTGSRRGTYRPAIDLLRRVADPVTATQLQAAAEAPTVAQHDLLAATLLATESAAGRPLLLRHSHGTLVAGPIVYEHLGGITVAGTPVTALDQVERAVAGATAPSG